MKQSPVKKRKAEEKTPGLIKFFTKNTLNNETSLMVLKTIDISLKTKYIFSAPRTYKIRDECLISFFEHCFSHSILPEIGSPEYEIQFDLSLDIILSIISYYPSHNFFNELVVCLASLLQKSKNQSISSPIPNKSFKLDHNNIEKSIFFLFKLLERSLKFYNVSMNVLPLIFSSFQYPNESLHLISFSCLLSIHTISIQQQIQIIRILMNYIYFHLENNKFIDEVNIFIYKILKQTIKLIPKSFLCILGSDFISYLSLLKTYSNYKFINPIFILIKKYIKSNYQIINICMPIIINYYQYFYQNKIYNEICLLISKENSIFKDKIWTKYKNEINFYPFLLKFGLINDFNFHGLLSINDNNLFYEIICSLLENGIEIPEFIIRNIKEMLINIPPLIHQISKLIHYFPENIFTINYLTKDYIYFLLYEKSLINNKLILPDNFKEYVLNSDDLRLISLYLKYNSNDKELFRNNFPLKIEELNNEKLWMIPYFSYSFSLFYDENIENNFFENILNNNNLKIFLYISKEKKLWKFFIKQIFGNVLSKTPKICCSAYSITFYTTNLNEILQKNSFLFCKYYIQSLPNKTKYLFDNIISLFPKSSKYSRCKFIPFGNIICPLCIKQNNKEALKLYCKECKNEFTMFKDYFPDTVKKFNMQFMLLESFSEIISYNLVKEPNNKQKFEFLETLVKRNLKKNLINDCYLILAFLLLSYGKRHKNSENAIIGLYHLIYEEEENNDFNDILIKLLRQHFERILYQFSHFTTINYVYKKDTINSLIELVKFIEPNDDNNSLLLQYSQYYPKILSIISLTIKDIKLTKKCLKFYENILMNCRNELTIKNLFCPIYSQIIPFFHIYPNLVTSILYILIKEKELITSCYFKLIAYNFLKGKTFNQQINNFKKLKQFNEIKKILSNYLFKSIEDKGPIFRSFFEENDSYIEDWCINLTSVCPSFRTLLLKQILLKIKSNPNEINKIKDKKYFVEIWSIFTSDSEIKNRILCSRIISLINIQQKTFDEIQINNTKNFKKKEEIFYLLSHFIAKCIENSSSIQVHDHAAYSIQKLLIKLKLFENENFEQNENWNKLSTKVQNLVRPYLRNKLQIVTKAQDFHFPICLTTNSLNNWLFSITKCILTNYKNIKPKIPVIYYHCQLLLIDSPELCKYVLQQIFIHFANNTNQQFITDIQLEFKTLCEFIENKEDKEKKKFAKQVLNIFFSIFLILYENNITPGTIGIDKKWICMNILNENELIEISLKCKLYLQSLIYIELLIHNTQNYNKKTIKNNIYIIFKNINDQDNLIYFEQGNNLNDILIKYEKDILINSTNKSQYYYELSKKELENGRYERALTDSMYLCSNTYQLNIKSNAILAKSALYLQRWDIIRNINDNIIIKSNDYQSSIDILTSKLLYYNHINNITKKKMLIKLIQNTLYKMLNNISYISYQNYLPILSQFRLIEEISNPKLLKFNEFKLDNNLILKSPEIERIISIHISLIKDYNNITNKDKLIFDQWLYLSKFYRNNSEYIKSQWALIRGNQYIKEEPIEGLIEKSKILMNMQQYDNALLILKKAKNTFKYSNPIFLGKINFLLAKCSKITDSLVLEEIKTLYEESSKLYEYKNSKIYFQLANLYDKIITKYYQSLTNKKQETNVTKNNNKRRIKHTPFTDNNQNSIKTKINFIETNLPNTISNYLMALKYSLKYSHEILPRILSLIFDISFYITNLNGNNNNEDNSLVNIFSLQFKEEKKDISDDIEEVINKNINKINNMIWLTSITQLISRIEQNKKYQKILNLFLKQIIIEYPLSVLWHLMSTKHSNSKTRNEKFEELFNEIINSLNDQQQKDFLSNSKTNYINITTNLINFIKQKINVYKSTTIKATEICNELKYLFEDSQILMPITSYLQSKYLNDYLIKAMDELIIVLPSRQKPKKIKLISCNGKSFSFLCKIDDDLRKDMRMMEFASFMNKILLQDRNCKQRNLSLTTFTVICLNEECGLIEWVENTIQLRSIIEKYIHEQNKGLSLTTIQELLLVDQPMNNNINQKRINNFINQILPKFPPVLYLWFISLFKQVSTWYQAKIAYMSSISVWSMVGYIVGLGDRHTENILLHLKTGACLHVDFSCLFDKAKILDVPELVPFRLTQNIVDGLGILKTKGAFAVTCKYTMELMRLKKDKILSVLQTFVNDPLIEWKKNGETGEEQAMLAMREVERRLAGWSEDRVTVMSPELMVEKLIAEATDNTKLALMYVGWQPYY